MKYIDKLKQMNSGELAIILSNLKSCDTCIVKGFCNEQPMNFYCDEVIQKWLESEANDGTADD